MRGSTFQLSRLTIVISSALVFSACSLGPIRGAHSDSFGKNENMTSRSTSQESAIIRESVSQNNTGGGTVVTIEEQAREINRLRRELSYAELRARSGGVVVIDGAAQTDASQQTAIAQQDDELLPPNARPGECYARVYTPPQYEQYSEEVLVSEASEEVQVIPAKYVEAEKRIMVSEASKRYETRPAVYETITEEFLVRNAERMWHVSLDKNSAPANAQLLSAARAGGINLEAATPGMCFHEHYEPAKYDTVTEEIVIRDGADQLSVAEPEYTWTEQEIVIKEASFEMKSIPAKYETVTERVIDKPAHTIWKKGTGPIQRIDESTGEIMCLVEVPATYKEVSRRVLVSPARTERVEIPAVTKTMRVKVLANEGQVNTRPSSPQTRTISKQVKTSEERFFWHEIHNMDHPASTRTGNQICLVETPAKYETVRKEVIKTPAQRVEIDVPAQYEYIKVSTLAQEAQEIRTPIPAVYDTISHQRLVKEGYMEWRSILCDTNMTRSRISSIQTALQSKGYNPGRIDGVIGSQTMAAVNEYQRANGLPVDEYLNIETVEALGVTPN